MRSRARLRGPGPYGHALRRPERARRGFTGVTRAESAAQAVEQGGAGAALAAVSARLQGALPELPQCRDRREAGHLERMTSRPGRWARLRRISWERASANQAPGVVSPGSPRHARIRSARVVSQEPAHSTRQLALHALICAVVPVQLG